MSAGPLPTATFTTVASGGSTTVEKWSSAVGTFSTCICAPAGASPAAMMRNSQRLVAKCFIQLRGRPRPSGRGGIAHTYPFPLLLSLYMKYAVLVKIRRRFRFYPTPEQEAVLARVFGACR